MRKAIYCLAAAGTLGLSAGLPATALADSSAGTGYQTSLSPVPTNHVTGSGSATVSLSGDQATVTVDTTGLLAGVPHAMHIHVDGMGTCPTAAAATDLNGHTAISTTDGHPAYGMIGTSLTTSGDTSPNSGLAVDRFPTGSSFHYQRTLTVTDDVAGNIRDGKAVIVVHGIDYDGSGKFTNVLGASDLDPKLPQTATAPALCGALHAMPAGGAATGSGATQHRPDNAGLIAGGSFLLIAAGAGTWVLRRRPPTGADRS
ncbi:hypothetical protein [Kitasatospora cineracea]|uniref:CHRD domain-containing protein n=1 Tax=Kitasatospora cineracea TaxID=88074 RepID=A0A8G1UNX7_9ACTN|nr:hypothetical protein [Kitasatospora cineracea]ROR46379.1 hypothetical protein EDD39_4646 [Kitasatospora cineracea]